MQAILLAGKPVWVEDEALNALEDGLRLSFEPVVGKTMPEFQGLWISVQCGFEILKFVKVYTATKHLRHVATWLSRVSGKAYIENDEGVLLCYEHGRVGPPFNTPYPQDIDTYTKL